MCPNSSGRKKKKKKWGEKGLENAFPCASWRDPEQTRKNKKERDISYLGNLELVAPEMNELGKHAVGSTLVDLAQTAKLGQLVIGHAHIHFIRLHIGLCDRFQFCSRRRVQEAIATQELK